MKNLKLIITALILILGLTNCSASYFTLTPDEESKLEMGRQVVEKEDGLIYSSLSFEENTDNEFIFNLFVYNKGNENILIDPKEIYIKVYNDDKQLITNQSFYAVDPEEQIAQINSDIKSRDTDHDIATGFNIVFSLLDTFVDLADDEDNDVEEVAENAIIFTGNQINEEISYDNDMEYLNSQKKYWKNSVLRKTELNANEEVQGIIYLPIFNEAEFVKVHIPIGKTVHTYKFKQIAH